jgi:hypothetical protein
MGCILQIGADLPTPRAPAPDPEMIEMAWHESAQRVSNIQAKAIPSFRFNLAILLSGEKKLANRLWHRSLTIERIPPQTIAYRLISGSI